MQASPLPIDGLVIIDKPGGWTSHDVVARMRRLTGVRRIGHAGTLDPLATGVLPLGIGQGTRVLEYVSDAEKEYVATVRLGVATDTYDADGRIVATADWTGIGEAHIREILPDFTGQIDQRPPVFSAIKHRGVPLHRLARAGRDVDVPARTVTIFAIDVVAFDLPDVVIRVQCSKGTYIRSLAHDLGQELGCGAHLGALRRTATGGFALAQALTLDRWEQAITDGDWPAHVLPLDAPLAARPALILDAQSATRLQDGVAPAAHDAGLPPNTLARAYGLDGVLLAILRRRQGESGWRAEKVFVERSGVRP
ncbi:MAG: tRNA pseudouridine(55) synthase TruB [Dehalococcoidia bacterium]